MFGSQEKLSGLSNSEQELNSKMKVINLACITLDNVTLNIILNFETYIDIHKCVKKSEHKETLFK